MTGERRTTEPSRLRLSAAGVAVVALAIGLLELVAGLFGGIPSIIDAVGEMLIPFTPPALKDFAVETFGTTDKAVLQVGIAVVTLGVGAWAGTSARHSWDRAVTIFVTFTGVGGLAMLLQTSTNVVASVVVLLVTAALGLRLLRWVTALTGVDHGGPARPQPTAATAVERADYGRPGGPEGVVSSSHPDARPLSEVDRRRFLVAAGTMAAAGALAGSGGRQLMQGAGVDLVDVTLSPALDPAPPLTAANQLVVEGITPIIVPNDEFYKIDVELGVPRISSRSWELRVRGMVDRELRISYDDLTARPMIERYVTIACVSNEVGDDLVGNAKWLGVPLADLLEEAGVQPGADQLVGRADGGWTAGFPTELAFDGRDAMVAVGMNDEPLPLDHGFPARLIVPGLYGYVSATKWLREIELTTWDGFDAYWIPRGWAKEGPIKTQSRIDVPRAGRRVDAGLVDVAGVAWAPTRGIDRVEVQLDDQGWIDATLSEPLSKDAWVQWSAQVDLDPGEHVLRVRATDGTGATQTSELARPRPDGATGWHTIRITAG